MGYRRHIDTIRCVHIGLDERWEKVGGGGGWVGEDTSTTH